MSPMEDASLAKREVFLANLVRSAANSYVGAVAVENLVAVLGWTALAVMIVGTVTALTTIVVTVAGASVL